MMPERHRLGGLQMGKTRHDGCGMGERLLGERELIGGKRLVDGVDRIPDPEPKSVAT